MINKKLKSGLLFFSPYINLTYITNNYSNKKSNIIRYSPKKTILSYGIIGMLSAFSHSALAVNPSTSDSERSGKHNASAGNNGNAVAAHLSSNKAVTPTSLMIDQMDSLSASDANSTDETAPNKRADKKKKGN